MKKKKNHRDPWNWHRIFWGGRTAKEQRAGGKRKKALRRAREKDKSEGARARDLKRPSWTRKIRKTVPPPAAALRIRTGLVKATRRPPSPSRCTSPLTMATRPPRSAPQVRPALVTRTPVTAAAMTTRPHQRMRATRPPTGPLRMVHRRRDGRLLTVRPFTSSPLFPFPPFDTNRNPPPPKKKKKKKKSYGVNPKFGPASVTAHTSWTTCTAFSFRALMYFVFSRSYSLRILPQICKSLIGSAVSNHPPPFLLSLKPGLWEAGLLSAALPNGGRKMLPDFLSVCSCLKQNRLILS